MYRLRSFFVDLCFWKGAVKASELQMGLLLSRELRVSENRGP